MQSFMDRVPRTAITRARRSLSTATAKGVEYTLGHKDTHVQAASTRAGKTERVRCVVLQNDDDNNDYYLYALLRTDPFTHTALCAHHDDRKRDRGACGVRECSAHQAFGRKP